MPDHSQRILAVKLDHIGDFALAVPALRTLADRAPVDVVVGPWNAGWREVLPWLNEFYLIEFPGYQKGRGRRASKWNLVWDLVNLGQRLRANRYQSVADLRTAKDDWRGKLIARLSGAPRRLGSSGKGSWLLTEVCEETADHQSEQVLQRLQRIDPGLAPAHTDFVNVARRALPRNRPHLLLHPGSGGPSRRWLPSFWLGLAQRLFAQKADLTFQFIGGEGERAIIESICQAVALKFSDQIISTNLRDTLQHLADCDLVVGVNSAAPHLAHLVGTPAITIFSAANRAEEWRALGDNTVLFHPIECSPCHLADCKWDTHRCMEAITPERVLSAIWERLNQGRH